MKNLEFQWLILKIDEMAAKTWLACLLCYRDDWKMDNSGAIILALLLLQVSISLC